MSFVRALKDYKASKTKEEGALYFKKGEIIVVDQQNNEKLLFHGSYEGKKGMKSGWFPSFSVKALNEKEIIEHKKSKKYLQSEEKKKKEEEKVGKKLVTSNSFSSDAKKEMVKDASRDGETSSSNYNDKDKKEKKKKFLSSKIASRPTKESLVERGILVEPPSNTMRKIEKLSSFLVSRPPREQVSKVLNADQEKKMFGIPLGQVMFTTYTEFRIPPQILVLIKYIEEKGMDETGIFRISGGTGEINALKEMMNKGEDISEKISAFSVHSASGVLKLFFRQLPEPLFTFDLFDSLVKSTEIEEEAARLEKNKAILKQLPKHNYSLIAKLFLFLAKITKLSEVNKMNSSNLGIVFGPTLLWGRDSNPVTDMMSNVGTSEVVGFMIDHSEQLFSLDDMSEVEKNLYSSNSSGANSLNTSRENSTGSFQSQGSYTNLLSVNSAATHKKVGSADLSAAFGHRKMGSQDLTSPKRVIQSVDYSDKEKQQQHQMMLNINLIQQQLKRTQSGQSTDNLSNARRNTITEQPTTIVPPSTFENLSSSAPMEPTTTNSTQSDTKLPDGWEKAVDSNGKVFYVDHLNKRTQWEIPTSATPSNTSTPLLKSPSGRSFMSPLLKSPSSTSVNASLTRSPSGNVNSNLSN